PADRTRSTAHLEKCPPTSRCLPRHQNRDRAPFRVPALRPTMTFRYPYLFADPHPKHGRQKWFAPASPNSKRKREIERQALTYAFASFAPSLHSKPSRVHDDIPIALTLACLSHRPFPTASGDFAASAISVPSHSKLGRSHSSGRSFWSEQQLGLWVATRKSGNAKEKIRLCLT